MYNKVVNPNEKKMVTVVKELCQHLAGLHGTVYVDRFYTSLELMKELQKLNIYMTGMMMRNHIPKELTIAKSGKEFKQMRRGDVKRHLYEYQLQGEMKKAGLVC